MSSRIDLYFSAIVGTSSALVWLTGVLICQVNGVRFITGLVTIGDKTSDSSASILKHFVYGIDLRRQLLLSQPCNDFLFRCNKPLKPFLAGTTSYVKSCVLIPLLNNTNINWSKKWWKFFNLCLKFPEIFTLNHGQTFLSAPVDHLLAKLLNKIIVLFRHRWASSFVLEGGHKKKFSPCQGV